MGKIRKRILGFGIVIAVFALAAWIIWDNARIVITTITIADGRLPDAFEGYRIAQVSDLHNDEFGEGNEELIALLESVKPDMIAITGDLLDSRRTDAEKALHFVRQAMRIAPCYYVTGNHESRVDEYRQLEAHLLEEGVTVLRDEAVTLEKDGAQITVLGLDDPRFKLSTDKPEKMENVLGNALAGLLKEVGEEEFTLLLSHRPELFKLYCEYDVDVVLSGHVHGGQFRLPFIGGVIGPSQGIFPEYDAGLYEDGGTKMVVSRGLGQSIFPFRVNNPPELVVVELVSGK